VKVRHRGEKSLQAPAKKGSLEGAPTCNLVGEHDVLDKKKVKFSTNTHRSEGLFGYVHVRFGDLLRLHRLEVTGTLSLLLIIYLRHCWIYPMRQRCEP